MSLPPVVSDPTRCDGRPGVWPSHDWKPERIELPEGSLIDVVVFEVCRYCGGRKP